MYFTDISELNIDPIDVNDIELVTRTTYNEDLIVKKIAKTKEMKLLQCIAIQLALVGWGNRNYGSVKVDGVEHEVVSTFDRLGFRHSLSQSEKLLEDDVTPSRLVRVFRFHIKKFLTATGKTSYLYNKYIIDKTQIGNKSEIFPFAESSVRTMADVKLLRQAYIEMDKKLGTSFLIRCDRVLVARGISL